MYIREPFNKPTKAQAEEKQVQAPLSNDFPSQGKGKGVYPVQTEEEDSGRLSIHEWAEEDRPREKLLTKGAEALSEAELLAILIGSGSTKESAVDLMRRVMNEHGNSLKALGRMTLQELTGYNGLGPAKAVSIMAACELGKRRMREPADVKQLVDTSEKMYKLFRSRMMDLTMEQCHVLLLDIKNQPIGYQVVAQGGTAASQVDIKVVLRLALQQPAVSSIVFCHNHPSGNSHPSKQDDDLTRQLAAACKAVSLRLTDHIVLGDGQYYSYFDNGKL